MRRLRLLAPLTLAAALCPLTAFALQDDGLIEHMSGPGPFVRFPSIDIRVLCVTRVGDTPANPDGGENHARGVAPWGRGSTAEFGVKKTKESDSQAKIQCARDEKVRGYLTVAYGHYFSLENNLFPNNLTDDRFKVKAESISLRYMGRTARDVVDVGFGLNLFWFHGKSFESFVRPSVEPFRISVAPFAALRSTEKTRAIHLTVAPTIFIGKMDQDDFCNTNGCRGARPFSTRAEILWATSVEVDLVKLITGQ